MTAGWRHGLRVMRVLLATQYATMLEYRAEIALWALSGVLPLIMLGVWSGSGAGDAVGFGPVRLRDYFLAAFVVRQFTVVWVIHVFEEDALQGRLSPHLLQPLHPLWRYLSAHLAEQVTRIPFVAAILIPLLLFRSGGLTLPPVGSLLGGLVALYLAFSLRFLLQSLLTTFCFWTERAAALDRLLLIPYLFLSGLVAPLQTFPGPVRAFALATPFPWMVAFPSQLLAGQGADLWGGAGQAAATPGAPPALIGFAVIVGWILLLLPLCRWFWRAGVRRYAAMGA